MNSDYHINFAKSYPGAEVVGIVDKDLNKAGACAEKYRIPAFFSKIEELFDRTSPEVVHIVTPPQTHYAVAREVLKARCHALIEKPLALDLEQAAALYELADSCGVRICPMHNHFYDPCMSRADELVRSGAAGEIMNVESYYGLNTDIPAFREYPAPNVLPWLYTLPGGPYHDFMAHPLYVMLDYTGAPKAIHVLKKTHGVLPWGLPDELKIVIEGEKAFGTLTFSFAARPHLHFLRLFGSSMTVDVDFNTMTTVTHPVSRLPKAAQKATYNLSESAQRFSGTVSNVAQFVSGKLKPYQGMKVLIHRFYDSIRNSQDPPVSKQQALRVIATMDRIWTQVPPKPLQFAPHLPVARSVEKNTKKVLVTGGSGFLGKQTVQGLVEAGYAVRVLARKMSNIEALQKQPVEIFFGDIADMHSLGKAFEGVDVVIHAAAGTSGKKRDCDVGTVQGTRNVLEFCDLKGIRKLIYISSCSVYGTADYKTNQVVTEQATLERFPARRGDYSASKQAAEDLVRWAMERRRFPIVILRPGTIYGPGGELFSPMIGLSLFSKLFVVFGSGNFVLPYVYSTNLVDVIVETVKSEKADNRVFNVVDNHGITKRDYMERIVKKIHPGATILYCPLSLLSAATALQEVLCRMARRPPILTRYRLVSSQRNVRYDTAKLREILQWSPRVGFTEAADRIVGAFLKRDSRGEAPPEAEAHGAATALVQPCKQETTGGSRV
jgi:nucleoside-diphosphate-sugar epimerase/predicted dehydrogenase